MLDFDWRIHEAHAQLLRLFSDGRLQGAEAARTALGALRLVWAVQVSPRMHALPDMPGSLEALCLPRSADRCLSGLVDFQQRFTDLAQVDLQVSELHEADFTFAPDTTPVLFLSNALEPVYTSRKQFDALLQRVRAGLTDGGRAIFIHHAAGTAAFGIYELTAGPGGSAVVTARCKDPYIRGMKTANGVAQYQTWFESVTTAPKGAVPPCVQHPLLRTAAARAP
jgi:hypothetical protein